MPEVESLRGFAALCVAFNHCNIPMLFSPLVAPDRLQILVHHYVMAPLGWLVNGNAAVILFFVISGLVLSHVLDRSPAHGSARSYALFVWRRILRIYPAHLAALLIFVPLMLLTLSRVPVWDAGQLAAIENGLKPWVDGTVYGEFQPSRFLWTAALNDSFYNPVTWTLKVELLAGLLIPFFAAASRRGSLPIDAVMLAALVGAAFTVDTDRIPNSFLLFLPAFYLGCMVRTHGRALAAAYDRMGAARGPVLGVLFLILMTTHPALGATVGWFPRLFIISLTAFVILSVIVWAEGRPTALLLHPLARWMGRVSYSFYLWHGLILFAFTRLLFVMLQPETLAAWRFTIFFGTFAVTVALALGAGALSYRLIEKPFVRLGRGARLAEAFTAKRTGRPQGEGKPALTADAP